MEYKVYNQQSGIELGIYEADSEEEAIRAMQRDAGYDDPEDIPGGNDPYVIAKEVFSHWERNGEVVDPPQGVNLFDWFDSQTNVFLGPDEDGLCPIFFDNGDM